MELTSLYPVIATTRLQESRDFYTRYLGFYTLSLHDALPI